MEIPKLSKPRIMLVVEILTTQNYPSVREAEGKEDSLHFLCECVSLTKQRLQRVNSLLNIGATTGSCLENAEE